MTSDKFKAKFVLKVATAVSAACMIQPTRPSCDGTKKKLILNSRLFAAFPILAYCFEGRKKGQ